MLTPGTNRAIRNSCLWLLGVARLCLFDVRVCYPNSQSYRGFTTKQIYHRHESENKRMNANRVLEVEQGSCRPLVFTTTGGMTDECKRYHSRLAKLLSTKKGEDYSTTISWIRTSFIRPFNGPHI